MLSITHAAASRLRSALFLIFIVCLVVAICASTGCATGQGQQGQGDTRAVQAVFYIEHYSAQAGDQPLTGSTLTGTRAHNEQTMTLQPAASGSATASPTNAPQVDANVSGLPGVGN